MCQAHGRVCGEQKQKQGGPRPLPGTGSPAVLAVPHGASQGSRLPAYSHLTGEETGNPNPQVTPSSDELEGHLIQCLQTGLL